MITLVGVVFILWGLSSLYRPNALMWALGAAAALPSTAAITVGATSVPPFYVLAVPATALAVLARFRLPLPARVRTPLAWFVGVSIVTSFIGPVLFRGVPILLPRGGIDQQVQAPTPLAFNGSIAAQLVYLVLGAGVVYYLAQRRAPVTIMTVAFVAGIGLATLRLVLEAGGFPWPNDQFQNFASAGYNVYETRFAGTFSEPSALGLFGTSAAVFFLFRVFEGRNWFLNIGMLGATLVSVWLSRSGTSAVALPLALALIIAFYAVLLIRGRRLSVAAIVAALATISLFAFSNPLTNAISGIIGTKSGSMSAANRSASDEFSLRLFADNYGLGVGLGANRPSSFATMLLSCVGIIGVIFFVVFIWRVLRGRITDERTRAAAWAFVALLVSKVLSEPAMSTPLLWLGCGTLVAATMTRVGHRTTNAGPAVTPANGDRAASNGRTATASVNPRYVGRGAVGERRSRSRIGPGAGVDGVAPVPGRRVKRDGTWS